MADDARNTEDLLAEATALLAQMKQLAAQAEDARKKTEEARTKADSEALLAFNAKQSCEDHATAVGKVKGDVESAASWFASTRGNVEAQVVAVTESAKAVATAKADADASQNAARAALEKAQSAASTATNAADGASSQRQDVATWANEVNQNRATVETQAGNVQALHTQVTTATAQVKTDGAAVADTKSKATDLLQSMEAVTLSANKTFDSVTSYELRLRELQDEFSAVRKQIEGLLPGATSAGLASAFQDQKARFVRPQLIWLATFLVAIGLLAVVGAYHLQTVNDAAKLSAQGLTWDLVLRHFTNRLLLVVPLVWLALVAGRNYSTAMRVQEDYAFKEAVSRSFEGYKKEMAALNIEGDVSPLLRLCEGVLNTLAERPGRLYDGKHDDVTPMTATAKAAKDIVDAAKGLIPTKTP